MALQGYLVSLGNGQLNSADPISGALITFNSQTNLGSGSWTWSGTTAGGATVTNQTANGTYYLGTDGSVYFVPTAGPVGTISAASAATAPAYDDATYGTTGNDAAISGNGDQDYIYGGTTTSATNTGNDTISAGAGNDVVYGGDGNDLIRGGSGSDTLFGGTGNDTIYGDDQTAPTTGTEHLSWTTRGGNNTNVANGFTQDTGTMRVTMAYHDDGAGTSAVVSTTATYVTTGDPESATSNLLLQGTGGGNTSTTSFSFDAKTGTNLADEVTNVRFRINDVDGATNGWQDVVTVRAYDINGNPVAVTLTPAGNDTVSGSTVTAGLTADAQNSAAGSVLVTIAGPVHYVEIDYDNALASSQVLYVSDIYFTTMAAADGNDSIDGGAGDDTIYGGGGDDVVTGGDGNDSIYGGTGNDSLSGGAGTDLIYGGDGSDTIDGGDGTDTIYGDAGNDIIDFGSGDDTVYGGDGDDVIDDVAGANLLGANYLSGDAGNDRIWAGGSNDTLYGGTGNDTLFGEDGDDSLYGDAGNDTLYGGAGNDTLTGGTGDDTMYGGDGADLFVITEDQNADVIFGGEGGTDADTVSFGNTATTQGVSITFTGAEAGTYAYIGGGATGTFAEIETLTTTAYNDTVNAAANTGAETISTGAGNDSILGGTGDEVIDAGTGNDTVNAGAGNDTIYGGAGNDSLIGGAGNDYVDAGTGSDTVGLGNGFGTDTLIGGEDAGNTDSDLLDASSMTAAATVLYTGNEAGTLTSGTDSATFSQFERLATGSGSDRIDASATTAGTTVSSGAGNDTLTGGSGNDSFDAGDGNDTLFGGTGNDTLLGGLGDDTLYGGSGNDSLNGGAGNDTLNGGAGADTLTGGGGTDTLDYSTDTSGVQVNLATNSASGGEAAGDVISGFTNLTGGSGGDTLTLSSTGGTLQGGAGDDTLTGGSGADTLYGGDGNDTLTGGTGADLLDGGAGNDVITFAEGDVVQGGDGDDLFVLQDLGEPTNGTITVIGGEGNETTGDVLKLGTLAQWNTLTFTNTDPGIGGGLSGSILLDDGTLLNFSQIEQIICFTPGTAIATPKGARAVETLRVGDLVVTRDHGLRPIRWIQSRTVPARGRFAPVRLRPGVVSGLQTDLLVSPQHRMLVTGYRAELLFGESEVLVAARHLIDGTLATQVEGKDVTYIHMMFDEHEVIYAEGAATESFHPGTLGLSAITDPAREELFALFPDLRSAPDSYGDTARRVLKRHEADLLRA